MHLTAGAARNIFSPLNLHSEGSGSEKQKQAKPERYPRLPAIGLFNVKSFRSLVQLFD